MKINKRILSPARRRVLEYGMKRYSHVEVPSAKTLSPELKRSFTKTTLLAMQRLGWIKYQPARYYVTGKGRKAFRDYSGNQRGRK